MSAATRCSMSCDWVFGISGFSRNGDTSSGGVDGEWPDGGCVIGLTRVSVVAVEASVS